MFNVLAICSRLFDVVNVVVVVRRNYFVLLTIWREDNGRFNRWIPALRLLLDTHVSGSSVVVCLSATKRQHNA